MELQTTKPLDRQRRGTAAWLNGTCCFCWDPARGGVAGHGLQLRLAAPAAAAGDEAHAQLRGAGRRHVYKAAHFVLRCLNETFYRARRDEDGALVFEPKPYEVH